MDASSFIRVRLYKSPLRVVAGVLLRSREVQVRRVQKQALVLQELRRECEELRRVNAQQALALQESQREVLQLRSENRQWREQPLELPCDLPLPQHGYGARMMAVCVNLAQATGLRSSVRCLRIVLDWLGVVARLPDWTTVRTWLMRAGVAAIEEPVEVADDWVWLADHSNQIGPEKVLVVLGVRASKLPPPGVALTHADMRVLAVEPGVSWKREDMSRVYATLAARVGAPQALVVDGAVELREGAEVLRTLRPDVVILSDFKHHAANVWKKIVGGSEAFTRFTTQVGRTRSAIQQTELAHLTPPGSRPKARFMNLAPTLTWARMALWQLDHPESLARATITSARWPTRAIRSPPPPW